MPILTKQMSCDLIDAAKNGDLERVALLINQGALVDAFDESFFTALFWAVVHGHKSIAKLLLDNQAAT